MTMTLTSEEVSCWADELSTQGASSAFELPSERPRTVIARLERPVPQWLPYVVSRLNELAELASQRDTLSHEGVRVPDPSVLERALVVTGGIFGDETSTPSVVPTIDGGVQFVWHKRGWDIEVEVLPDETEVWAQNRHTGVEFSGSLGKTLRQLQDVLEEISTVRGQ